MQVGLREWAAREPARIAATVNGEPTSYGAMERDANLLAQAFRRLGLRRGDHIALAISNDAFVFSLVWAGYRAGLYITPVPYTATAKDAAYVMRDCEARVVVIDGRLPVAAALPPLLRDGPNCLAFARDIEGCTRIEALMAESPAEPLADESPGALMLYTSGTTGAPKGVWRPLPEDGSGVPPFARDLLAVFDITSDARYLSTAPLYHAAPLRFSLAFTAVGATAVVMEKFDAARALDLLESERITHSQWVPTMFNRLLALPEARRAAFHAPAHRLALHSAAPCPVPLKRAMIAWWGPILQEYYAGSESVGLCTITSEEWLRKPGSVGRCRKGVLHILGEDWSELPPGQTGRIYFSGIPPFQYFNAPEKTAARNSPQGYQTFGDIGRVDEEGYLFMTDRQDDMIISGGVNIYPQELEAAILELPEVAECAVIGVADPDFGERPVAFVVARDEGADPAQLRARIDVWCLDRLGRIKRPKELHVLDKLPRSATGKLLRRELRSAHH